MLPACALLPAWGSPRWPAHPLSLPHVRHLQAPHGDAAALLLRQGPGQDEGVGVPLAVLLPRVEVPRLPGAIAEGGQAACGGLGGGRAAAHYRGDPLGLDVDGLLLGRRAGDRGRLVGGEDPAGGPGDGKKKA